MVLRSSGWWVLALLAVVMRVQPARASAVDVSGSVIFGLRDAQSETVPSVARRHFLVQLRSGDGKSLHSTMVAPRKPLQLLAHVTVQRASDTLHSDPWLPVPVTVLERVGSGLKSNATKTKNKNSATDRRSGLAECERSGCALVTFDVTSSGRYRIALTVNGVALPHSPISIEVRITVLFCSYVTFDFYSNVFGVVCSTCCMSPATALVHQTYSKRRLTAVHTTSPIPTLSSQKIFPVGRTFARSVPARSSQVCRILITTAFCSVIFRLTCNGVDTTPSSTISCILVVPVSACGLGCNASFSTLLTDFSLGVWCRSGTDWFGGSVSAVCAPSSATPRQ